MKPAPALSVLLAVFSPTVENGSLALWLAAADRLLTLGSQAIRPIAVRPHGAMDGSYVANQEFFTPSLTGHISR